jgi:hypothetical protein
LGKDEDLSSIPQLQRSVEPMKNPFKHEPASQDHSVQDRPPATQTTLHDLTEADLEQVQGGTHTCCTGKHIVKAILVIR